MNISRVKSGNDKGYRPRVIMLSLTARKVGIVYEDVVSDGQVVTEVLSEYRD